MKKFYSLFLAILLVVGSLAGCGEGKTENNNDNKEQSTAQEAAFPVTIKDAIDQEVVIEEKPEKIVSLMPSNTEIVFALGLGDELVGVSDYDNYPKEAAEKEKVGGMEFNVEKIISLNPDVVLAHASSAHNSTEGLQQIRDAGIDVVVVNDATSFEDVYKGMEMIGQATGAETEADKLVADMKEKLAAIKDKAAAISDSDQKSVYIEVSGEPSIFTTGTNTFMQEMLDTINAKNIISEEGWIQVDQEAVIAANPDAIITTYGAYSETSPIDQISSRKGWEEIKAVKEKQIVDVDSDMVTRSGPRLVEGVEAVAEAVYPDVFK
ncbi:ABC transporter substrate-binding protein [Niallia sp. Sow4_A1]|uniref:ABC transporter substrate-binding protein n=1 Tax=Niallia hominis TaxID=3133173 RepID=A0ABV1F249_9BACI|nr:MULTISPECIES: ABC transporter substrate-binding protein [Bacillaceae]MCF2649529.1 ABC transporter substrate-binding protein [Niallia circulans]MCM3361353.1 ABC transporter substrate-binding protein [Niallia sp. MER TA 168]